MDFETFLNNTRNEFYKILGPLRRLLIVLLFAIWSYFTVTSVGYAFTILMRAQEPFFYIVNTLTGIPIILLIGCISVGIWLAIIGPIINYIFGRKIFFNWWK